MSIEVTKISKEYGQQKALNEVSFSVGEGSITGFLGPNGAGKSTMMKILTCFIPQSSGTAKVCGFDVYENSFEVKQQVGYLPEHAPLQGEVKDLKGTMWRVCFASLVFHRRLQP